MEFVKFDKLKTKRYRFLFANTFSNIKAPLPQEQPQQRRKADPPKKAKL